MKFDPSGFNWIEKFDFFTDKPNSLLHSLDDPDEGSDPAEFLRSSTDSLNPFKQRAAYSSVH